MQAMQLFDDTFSFVDNEGANITLGLDALSRQLTSLQTNLTLIATQFDTGCEQLMNDYPTFAARLDCQQIKSALNADALAADIATARNTVWQTTSSISDALDSARSAVHEVEHQIFDTTAAAQDAVRQLSNSLFAQGECHCRPI